MTIKENKISNLFIGTAYLLKALFHIKQKVYMDDLKKAIDAATAKIDNEQIYGSIQFFYAQDIHNLSLLYSDPSKDIY